MRGVWRLQPFVPLRNRAVKFIAAGEDVGFGVEVKKMCGVLDPYHVNIAQHEVQPKVIEGLGQPDLLPSHLVKVLSTPNKGTSMQAVHHVQPFFIHGKRLDPRRRQFTCNALIHRTHQVVLDAVHFDVVDPVEYKVHKVVVGPGDDDHIVVRHAGCHLFRQSRQCPSPNDSTGSIVRYGCLLLCSLARCMPPLQLLSPNLILPVVIFALHFWIASYLNAVLTITL
mmetsp:Transcript_16419/g.29281  ORF Transcript_16419/g.29281 Transcript_16419/m.29281 type:complete len:225 (-) Transcript_16419:225-899(-)